MKPRVSKNINTSCLYSNETVRRTQYGQAVVGAQQRATVPVLQSTHTRVSHQGGHRFYKRDNESFRGE